MRKQSSTIRLILGIFALAAPLLTISSAGATTPVPVYRLYNKKTGEHFYTANHDEAIRNGCVNPGYIMEDSSYFMTDSSPVAGATTVSRLYSLSTGDRFYSIAPNEVSNALAHGYVMETPSAFLAHTTFPPAGGRTVFRLYNAKSHRHLYTWSASERDAAVDGGYTNEGNAFYLASDPEYATVVVSRLYNVRTNDHLYSANTDEIDRVNCTNPAYVNEGKVFYSSQMFGSTAIIQRLRSPNGYHLYSINPAEITTVQAAGFVLEDTQAFVVNTLNEGGMDAFFRLYKPANGDHLLTANQNERMAAVMSGGYTEEGLAFYASTYGL